ncbi:MAG: Fe-Mn family superoxide dismutase, partial [Bacteroidales bacterium]|nr:Fe-Mn family superoxide dismutase [Bacteroidales bacterium]
AILQLPNQDNPLMDISPKKGTPILAIDVWEHAYYLKYQNKRADYISNFWNVINWAKVNELYSEALKK